MPDARAAAELAARESYGRILAYLARRFRDLAAAEDALAEAFARALERWPGEGVPEEPDRWLLVVARRQLLDEALRAEVRARPEVARALEEMAMNEARTDDRSHLMFACAHPAIDGAVRPALTPGRARARGQGHRAPPRS